jgi:hypothetical protein
MYSDRLQELRLLALKVSDRPQSTMTGHWGPSDALGLLPACLKLGPTSDEVFGLHRLLPLETAPHVELAPIWRYESGDR